MVLGLSSFLEVYTKIVMKEIIPHKGICFQRTGYVLTLKQGAGDVDFHHTLFWTCLITSITKRGWGKHYNSLTVYLIKQRISASHSSNLFKELSV